MKNEPIARYSSGLNKVSGVSTVREVSKMLKQGRIACTTTLETTKKVQPRHEATEPATCKSLVPQCPSALVTSKTAAFTLAEVLITLAIIGIVAALTIPSLVQSYKERQYVSQLKKTYSVLQNAFQMAIAEHGTLDQWGLTNTIVGVDEDGKQIVNSTPAQLVFSYIEPYLNIVSYDLMNKSTRLYSLDGRYRETTPAVPSEDNKDLPSGGTLSDGSYFLIGWINSADCSLWGDICGDFWIYLPDKKMQLGVTQFNFYLTKNGLFPRGYTNDQEYTFEADCDINNKAGKSSDRQGRGCAAWVLYQGNMNYLHCDDLSWSGKKKCD